MLPKLIIGNAVIYHGNNLDVLPELASNSVDSIVCDPPYELGFMSKSWDNSGIAYNVEVWRQCLRVLKPGGYLLAFGGTRTWHRMAVAIEDAGFEIRDNIAWLYGSGFPKSHNIGKAIDKLDGMADEAEKWSGWGTALKPAHEPIVMARKNVVGTIAQNALAHGVGGLNIDATRVGDEVISVHNAPTGSFAGGDHDRGSDTTSYREHVGRFPANIILDEDTAKLLDEQADVSRFFYVAKASKRDRNDGLDDLEEKSIGIKGSGLARVCETCGVPQMTGCQCPDATYVNPGRKNFHPTVKPTALMQYLIRLVTPENGVVLDPFAGSDSTGKAAILEDKQFIGIELTDEYLPLIEGRLKHAFQTKDQ